MIKEYLDWKGKKTYTVRLKNINLKDKKFNLGFLRGLIDTDGNYYPPKRRLSFSTVSKELAYQVFDIISFTLHVQPKIFIYKKVGCSDLYTLSLHGKNSKNLIDLINPGNKNKRYTVAEI